jgi:hypothetical protein
MSSQNAITVRVSDDYRKEIDAIALREGKSINEVINNFLKIGSLVSKYVDQDSQVIVKHAKGFDDNEQVLLPIYEMRKRA